MIFHTKPQPVDAIQLISTEPVLYWNEQPEWLMEAYLIPVASRGAVWKSGTTARVGCHDGIVRVIAPRSWLVRDEDGDLYTYLPEDFTKLFTPSILSTPAEEPTQ